MAKLLARRSPMSAVARLLINAVAEELAARRVSTSSVTSTRFFATLERCAANTFLSFVTSPCARSTRDLLSSRSPARSLRSSSDERKKKKQKKTLYCRRWPANGQRFFFLFFFGREMLVELSRTGRDAGVYAVKRGARANIRLHTGPNLNICPYEI